jgi:PAP2 superfamily
LRFSHEPTTSQSNARQKNGLARTRTHFQLPYGMNSDVLEGWSSFPSDHAAFFFALSVVFFFICRRAGVFAIAYSALVVCLPRAYLGIHYPTDLIAGALLGIGVACLTRIAPLRQAVARPVLCYFEANPAVSYGSLSVLTFILGTVCEPVPELIRFAFKVMAAGLNRMGYPLQFGLGKQSMVEPLLVAVAACGTIAALTLLWRRIAAGESKDPEESDASQTGTGSLDARLAIEGRQEPSAAAPSVAARSDASR